METGNTDERVSDGWKGTDGERWSFVGTSHGPMIEVVKITNDRVCVAPHASPADLRNALEVLAELYRQQTICACVEREIIIDVHL